jgi:hypothetical protein
MNPSNPDIKLTAYALGELSEDERLAVEARIQNQPALQDEVDQIRALAAQLETELAGESAPALTDVQRQAILAAPGAGHDRGRLARFPWRKISGFAAVAAVVTLVFGGAFWTATRSLHGTLLAQIDEKGEMAVMDYEEQQLDELLEELSPPDELADLVIPITPPDVEMDMTPPPDIQEFAAAPVMYEIVELNLASEAHSPHSEYSFFRLPGNRGGAGDLPLAGIAASGKWPALRLLRRGKGKKTSVVLVNGVAVVSPSMK